VVTAIKIHYITATSQLLLNCDLIITKLWFGTLFLFDVVNA